MSDQYQNRSGIFTNDDINDLIKKDRTILLYENQVLDVTSYKHPGGQDFFINNIKKDVKKLFVDQNHSKHAQSLLDKYRIGYISSNDRIDNDSEVYKQIQELNKKIDTSKPLQPQIAKLTKEEFHLFLDRPQVLDSDDCVQFHSNKIIDWFFNKADLEFNKAVLIPVCTYLLYTTLQEQFCFGMILSMIFQFFIGLTYWTLVEYLGHRYLLHSFDNKQSRHLFHHAFINQKYYMAFPLHKLLMNGGLIFGLLYFPLGYDIAIRVICGYTIGQLIYDSIHNFIHHSGHKKTWGWLQKLKDQHMRHHYRHRNKEFGVSNGFWDYVFDTAI